MSVKINIPSYFQYFTSNDSTVEVDRNSVMGCLRELAEKYPDIRKLLFDANDELLDQPLNHVAVFINGVAVPPDALGSAVNDGDEIDIAYVVLGG